MSKIYQLLKGHQQRREKTAEKARWSWDEEIKGERTGVGKALKDESNTHTQVRDRPETQRWLGQGIKEAGVTSLITLIPSSTT